MSDWNIVVKNFYTNKKFDWLKYYYDKVNGVALYTILCKGDMETLKHLRKISKFIYVLENRHLLILLHSVIPKAFRQPFIKYFKKIAEKKIDELHKNIRKYFGYSEREYSYIKELVHKYIQRDIDKHFKSFGIKIKR